MTRIYDFIVVGAGVFGAWTAYTLRCRGFRVALLDAYGPAHSRSSSGGETRIIRMGYGPDELYTRFALRSLPMWKELADRAHQQLFHKTGVLWLSDGTDAHTRQMLEVLKANGVSSDQMSAHEIANSYPQFHFKNVECGILEPESGVLLARQAVQALVSEAIRDGVEYFLASVPVPGGPKLQEIQTGSGLRISAGAFIFACGPWLPKLFPELLADRIRPTRQEVFFLGVPAGDDSFCTPKMPAWLYHTHPLRPYALPDIASRGFKICFDRHGCDFDPDTGSRLVGAESIAELREYLAVNIPRLQDAPIVETRVCQYENTCNGDFLIDRHPESANVWLVGGGSGHGFKHGPVVGEYLCNLIAGKVPAEPRFSLASKQKSRSRAIF